MFRLVTFTFLLISINALAFGQAFSHDTTLLKKRYKQYIHKEVYNILLDDSMRSYKKLRIGQEPPGVLCCLDIELNDSVRISLHFHELKYQEMQNFDMNWNLNLLYKEKISGITFYFPDERNFFRIK